MDFCTFYQLINDWRLPLRGESKLVGFSKQASLRIPAEPPKAKGKSQEKGSVLGSQQPLLPEAGGGEHLPAVLQSHCSHRAQGHSPVTEAAGGRCQRTQSLTLPRLQTEHGIRAPQVAFAQTGSITLLLW